MNNSAQRSTLGESHYKIISLIGKEKRVLDVGCGRGYMDKILRDERSCSVVGIEADSQAAEEARSYCERIYVGDIESKGFLWQIKEREFDIIIFADVLEHLKSPESALRSFRYFLKSSGKILISTPNIAYWKIRKDMLLGRFEYQNSGILDRAHTKFFTFKSIQNLVSSCGYKIEQIDFTAITSSYFYNLISIISLRVMLLKLYRKLISKIPSLLAYQFIIKAGISEK